MNIQISETNLNPPFGKYRAKMIDLPGSPPVGCGETKEMAVAQLFANLTNYDGEDWTKFVDTKRLNITYAGEEEENEND